MVVSSLIGILKRLIVAEPRSIAGLLTILVTRPIFGGVIQTGFKSRPMLFIFLSCLLPFYLLLFSLLSFYGLVL